MKQYVSVLFNSRTQAHVYHLQTSSFAKHKALNEYYDDIIELVDGLVESYQGKYGILSGYESKKIYDLSNEDDIVAYFEKLAKYVVAKRKELPQDTNLQNIYDEIQTLVDSTLYKLKFLS